MKDLEKITRDRFRARYIPIEEASAADYYTIEAEIWVAQADGK